MKLMTYKPTVTTTKSFPGLLDCKFEHEVKTAKAELDYKGPFIPPEVWQQVLAFFQWTYDTTKSESQVRLFVNTKEGTWAPWAFPQKAQTGMTAQEIADTPDWKTQRAQFSDNDGWIYFGTVHHHCSSSAFQSGVDKANEENQDGLHITVGKMASDRYDLHCRFYLGGFEFDPDMSEFWAVGNEVANLIPEKLWDVVARHQMCEKPASDTRYPDEWKANLIEVKTTFPSHKDWTPGTSQGIGYGSGYSSSRSNYLPLWQRARKALGKLADEVVSNKFTQKHLVDYLEELATSTTVTGLVLEVCKEFDCDPQDMWQEIPHDGELDGIVAQYQRDKEFDSKAGNGKSLITDLAEDQTYGYGGCME